MLDLTRLRRIAQALSPDPFSHALQLFRTRQGKHAGPVIIARSCTAARSTALSLSRNHRPPLREPFTLAF